MLKLFLFGVILFILYKQIARIEESRWEAFNLKHPIGLGVMIILLLPNLGIEFLKWRLTLKTLQLKTSSIITLQSYFAGLVTGMLTPNMLGNFIGRFYYFDRKHRVQIILLTLLTNFAQYISSLTFGWVSILVLGGFLIFKEQQQFVVSGIGLILIVSYLIFFFFDNFLLRFKRKSYAVKLKQNLKRKPAYRFKLLLLSFVRFIVFTTQFSLLLYSFGEEINLEIILAIWQVYLLTIVAPSLFLGKIGVKETIAIVVLGSIGVNEFSILFASLIVWVVNNVFPALVGVIISKKVLKR